MDVAFEPEDLPGPPIPREYYGNAAEGYVNGPADRPEKVRLPHEMIIDLLVANPRITQKEIAARLGYTAVWVNRIHGSDAFQAALAARRKEFMDPIVADSIDQMMNGVIRQSLDIIAEKLESTQSADLALKSLEITGKAMGFGARDRNPPQITNNFVVALPGKAPDASSWAEKAASGGYDRTIDEPRASLHSTITHNPLVQLEPTKLAEDES